MINKFILIFLVSVFFSSCNAQKTKSYKLKNNIQKQQSTTNKMQKIYYFKEGENKFLKEFETNFTVKSVTEDSRCPKNVQCIWQGVASVELELMGIYTRPKTVVLSTTTNPEKGYFNTIDFNDLTIKLEEISPYPTQNKNFDTEKGNYTIGISIQKKQ